MNIQFAESFEAMSATAASIVLKMVREKPNLLLGAASGNSPSGLYKKLAESAAHDSSLFHRLSVIKLDEWSGVPMSNPHTCEAYLIEQLLRPLQISSCRYISFNSMATKPEAECKRIQQELLERGPIDVCVLGLGLNGHVAFNEPGDFLQPFCHAAKLSEESKRHAMARRMNAPVEYGLSLGITGILSSGRILLLVTGEGKSKIINRLLTGQITTALPASFLWLHANATCIIDQTAMN